MPKISVEAVGMTLLTLFVLLGVAFFCLPVSVQMFLSLALYMGMMVFFANSLRVSLKQESSGKALLSTLMMLAATVLFYLFAAVYLR